jgi:hypothetical protein
MERGEALTPEVEQRIRSLAVELGQVRHGVDDLILQLAGAGESTLAGIVRGRLECIQADLRRSVLDLLATAEEEGGTEACVEERV